jgi:hypothetical protein
MPTKEQLDRDVAEFEGQYPESLSDRLQWWAQVLDIDRRRVGGLLGLSRKETAELSLSDLERVVSDHEDRAELVDDMLGQLLASFDYDLAAFRAALHRPIGPKDGEKNRISHRPEESLQLPSKPRAEVRRGALLNEIFAGGPVALPALQAYLSEPTTRRRGAGG